MSFRHLGKQKTLHIGPWPEISLAEARVRRDDARKALATGVDPVLEMKRAQVTAKFASATSFKGVALKWIAKCEREGRAEVTLDKVRRLLNMASPLIGRHPIDVTKLEALRADLNHSRGAKPKLTMLPQLITARCRTLPEFAMIKARYDDEAGVVTRHGAVHLGLATQPDAGLMVPVIRNAEQRNIWQLAAEIARLAGAARSGKATAA